MDYDRKGETESQQGRKAGSEAGDIAGHLGAGFLNAFIAP